MGAFVVVGLVDPVARDLGLTAAGAGWILTIYALAYAILSPLLVALTGGLGRRAVLLAGLGIFAAANVAAALAPGPAGLLTLRVVAAAGAGLVTPVTAAVAVAVSPPERRARAIAAVLFGLTLAQVAGVPAGSFLAYTLGWRSAFWAVALLALPCLWLLATKVPPGLGVPAVRLADLARVLADGRLMLAILFTTTFLGAIFLLYSYLGPLLNRAMGFERNGITAALVLFGIGAVVGNLAGGWAADRAGVIRTLTALCLLQAATMPLFALMPMAPVLLMILILVWSLSGWSFGAGQQVRLVSLAPKEASVVLALNAAAIYVGAAVGSAAGGAVLAISDVTVLGPVAGIGALLALLHLRVSARLAPHD